MFSTNLFYLHSILLVFLAFASPQIIIGLNFLSILKMFLPNHSSVLPNLILEALFSESLDWERAKASIHYNERADF